MKLNIQLEGQRLLCQAAEPLVAGSIGEVTFTVARGSGWEDLTVSILFENGEVCKEVLDNGQEQAVPWEALAPGRLYLSAVGRRDGLRRTTVRQLWPLPVLPAGAIQGTPTANYTPALWEQVMSRLEESCAAHMNVAFTGDTPPQAGKSYDEIAAAFGKGTEITASDPEGKRYVLDTADLSAGVLRFTHLGGDPLTLTRYIWRDGAWSRATEPGGLAHRLIFTGAATGVFDGTQDQSVHIPILTVAAPDYLGGVRPTAKTTEQTQPVGIDSGGRLWTAPGGTGQSSGDWHVPVCVCSSDSTAEAKICRGILPLTGGTPVTGQLVLVYLENGNSADTATLAFSNFSARSVVCNTSNTGMAQLLSHGPHLLVWRGASEYTVTENGQWDLLNPADVFGGGPAGEAGGQ